jgi:carboxyl-terminal processing protease
MSKEDTLAVEEALAANGFDPGVVDGFMDNDTRAAIREFQKDNDLVITGAVDKNTAQLLGIAASESSS